jgi:WhiB family redox-sensing transcriptional regulator
VKVLTSAGGGEPKVEWLDRARCRDEDPELFFPVGTTGPAATQLDEAKAVCDPCEVREICLEWALLTGQDAGIWGGLSEEERRALRRARRRREASQMAAVG